jgi:hypothetical protein
MVVAIARGDALRPERVDDRHVDDRPRVHRSAEVFGSHEVSDHTIGPPGVAREHAHVRRIHAPGIARRIRRRTRRASRDANQHDRRNDSNQHVR